MQIGDVTCACSAIPCIFWLCTRACCSYCTCFSAKVTYCAACDLQDYTTEGRFSPAGVSKDSFWPCTFNLSKVIMVSLAHEIYLQAAFLRTACTMPSSTAPLQWPI